MPSDPTALYEKLRLALDEHKPFECGICPHWHCGDCIERWPCSTISSVAEALGVSLDG